MKYIKTYETYNADIPKAVAVEQEITLMDKDVNKELTHEEIEELKEEEPKKKKTFDKYKTKKSSFI